MGYVRFKSEKDLLKSVLHSLYYDDYPRASVTGGRKLRIVLASMWNFFREDFNKIFEVLAEAKEPISLRRLYEFLLDIDPDIGGYETFRKPSEILKEHSSTYPASMRRLGRRQHIG